MFSKPIEMEDNIKISDSASEECCGDWKEAASLYLRDSIRNSRRPFFLRDVWFAIALPVLEKEPITRLRNLF